MEDLYMAGSGISVKLIENPPPSPELYNAGEYLFPNRVDLHMLGYNRLVSYAYQKKLVDQLITIKLLKCKQQIQNGGNREESSMDLFLAGAAEKDTTMDIVLNSLKSNVLFSYVNEKGYIDKYKLTDNKLFIDSGAFSAWTKGKQIDVDGYIAWINERSEHIDLYGQIDVIPGDKINGHTQHQVKEAAAATWQNYLYMRPKMKNPKGLLYTFHVGEPLEFLRNALEWKDNNGEHIPYIALGGMVGKSRPVRIDFLDSCFKTIKASSNPNVRVHAFGMTSFDILARYPGITSADSTSWIMTGAIGCIMSTIGTICVSEQKKNEPNHYSHLKDHQLEQFQNEVCKYGFSLDELSKNRDCRIMHNARYMYDRMNSLEYIKGPKRTALF